MAMMISWVAPVNPSHPYLENDPAPSFDRNICAFHLGFSLAIAEKCIDLSRIPDERELETRIVANLDSSNSVSESMVCDYLKQYVRFLPVPVFVNGRVISQESFADVAIRSGAGFDQIFRQRMTNQTFEGMSEVSTNPQGRVFVRITDTDLNGTRLKGEACLVQDGGATHAYRNFFGLAPVPVSGHYRLGGYVNLDILHPTAGREALSRDSIQHISNSWILWKRLAVWQLLIMPRQILTSNFSDIFWQKGGLNWLRMCGYLSVQQRIWFPWLVSVNTNQTRASTITRAPIKRL